VYDTISEWIHDVELVFSNCKKYNGIQSEIGQIGVNCQAEFQRFLDVYGVKERFINNANKESANGHVGGSLD
jgi:hypothetical protein